MKHKTTGRLAAVAMALAFMVGAFAACGGDKKPAESSTNSVGQSSSAVSGEPVGSDDPVSGESEPSASGEPASNPSSGSPVSGSNASSKPNSSKPNPSSTASVSSGKANGKLLPDQKVNMGGYKFSIVSMFLPTKITPTSTLFEKQFIERKEQVEKQYNCTISVINTLYPSIAVLKPYILAGKKIADLVEMGPAQMVAAAEMDYITSWDKYIDSTDARWVEAYTNLGKYRNTQYGLQFYRPPEVRYCVVFNKTLLKANGIDPNSLYTAVKNGTWNFDMLRQCAIACTKDTDNDGKMNTYGIIGNPSYIAYGLLHANGGRLATLGSGGKVTATFNNAAAVKSLEFFNDLVNTDKVVYTKDAALGTDKAWNTVTNIDYTKEFLNGKAAFLLWESWVLNQQVKKGAGRMEYGMLPYPKGPNASGYVSTADNARLFCLTSTNKEADKTATIFKALARPLGDEDGLDYWDDIQADYFQSSDKQSLEMYKLCLNNSIFDTGAAVEKLFADYTTTVVAETVYLHDSTPTEKLKSLNGVYDSAIKSIFKK